MRWLDAMDMNLSKLQEMVGAYMYKRALHKAPFPYPWHSLNSDVQ